MPHARADVQNGGSRAQEAMTIRGQGWSRRPAGAIGRADGAVQRAAPAT